MWAEGGSESMGPTRAAVGVGWDDMDDLDLWVLQGTGCCGDWAAWEEPRLDGLVAGLGLLDTRPCLSTVLTSGPHTTASTSSQDSGNMYACVCAFMCVNMRVHACMCEQSCMSVCT